MDKHLVIVQLPKEAEGTLEQMKKLHINKMMESGSDRDVAEETYEQLLTSMFIFGIYEYVRNLEAYTEMMGG